MATRKRKGCRSKGNGTAKNQNYILARSGHTKWGDAYTTIASREYYLNCTYEMRQPRQKINLKLYDCLEVNFPSTPFPIVRIVGMYEMGRKRWFEYQWFWRKGELLTEIVNKQQETPDDEELEVTKKYVENCDDNEVFATNSIDANYPSTLIRKCCVKHFTEVPDCKKFLKGSTKKSQRFIYKKHVDLETFVLRDVDAFEDDISGYQLHIDKSYTPIRRKRKKNGVNPTASPPPKKKLRNGKKSPRNLSVPRPRGRPPRASIGFNKDWFNSVVDTTEKDRIIRGQNDTKRDYQFKLPSSSCEVHSMLDRQVELHGDLAEKMFQFFSLHGKLLEERIGDLERTVKRRKTM
mmetsp:Transcript_4924/g.5334  ORF Transcript_4924/g.5334 Transcript_4924/m.5334 type:complete len:349 (-) Transcript_4924:24-1070(-)